MAVLARLSGSQRPRFSSYPRVDAPTVEDASGHDSQQSPYNPVYEQRRYYVGLGEWIVIHKGPDGYYCVREDGQKQSCVEVQKEEEAAYFEKYGVMTQGLWHLCETTLSGEELPAGVAYHVDEPLGLLSPDNYPNGVEPRPAERQGITVMSY